MIQPVDILFIGAHPDDIELACGAMVAKCVRDGRTAGIVDLTSGEMGTRGTAVTRKREAASAAKVLGARFREQLDFRDGGLLTGREQELILIDVIRRARPSIVFAPYPEDRHPDHARAGRLVHEVSFYAGLKQLSTGTAAHRPQAVVFFLQHYVVDPTFIVDVTAVWKTKMRAIAAFKSQFYDPKSKGPQTNLSKPEFIEMIEARGRHFGGLIGAKYGEAFVTKQPPKIADVVAAYSGREV